MNQKAKILALIPARMGSSRFPGKPLEKILGKPMIGHVYDNVKKNNLITEIAVATCDSEIAEYIDSIGGSYVMTGSYHKRATDRCAEALEILEKEDNIKYDIVIMIQGDEPMINSKMISEGLNPMIDDPSLLITNLMGKIENDMEFKDPNVVKVVCDIAGNALYFSREPIPKQQNIKTENIFKQYGIIIFQRNFLLKYLKMNPTPLEVLESIDMLRIVENRLPLKMILSKFNIYTVDTPSELIKVEDLMRNLSK
ncbi:MAG: 3-deoxy-manno-octulosonate cytidylyltransferase [SAR202 cluster bacterium]|nr:3-deoxy-manno-octulosonate cytidylyltransferase [SAR202 cluster bacterium]